MCHTIKKIRTNFRLATWVFLIISSNGYSQNMPKESVRVEGLVLDKSGKGVANINITDYKNLYNASTNQEGRFVLDYPEALIDTAIFKMRKGGVLVHKFNYKKGGVKIQQTNRGWKTFDKDNLEVCLEYYVRGVIRSAKNGKPVKDAEVTIHFKFAGRSGYRVGWSNSQGRFDIPIPGWAPRRALDVRIGTNYIPVKVPDFRQVFCEIFVKKLPVHRSIVGSFGTKINTKKRLNPIKKVEEDTFAWKIRITNLSDQSAKNKEFARVKKREADELDSLKILEYKTKLGYLKALGIGVLRDTATGMKEIKKAWKANESNVTSLALQGDVWHLFKPKSEQPDSIIAFYYNKAIYCYKRAAMQGDRYARIQLAHMYYAHRDILKKKEYERGWLDSAYRLYPKKSPINPKDYLHRVKSCHLKQDPFDPIIVNSQELLNDLIKPYQDRVGEMVFVKGGRYTHVYPEKVVKVYKHAKRSEKVIDFAIGKFEVTVGQFRMFLNETSTEMQAGIEKSRYQIENGSIAKDKISDYPVVGVSWDDAVAFCQWLSDSTGLTFRLPFENEWEYAALGGHKADLENKTPDQYPKYAGGDTIDAVAVYRKKTEAIGRNHPDYGVKIDNTKKNILGMHNMAGNAEEWCYRIFPGVLKKISITKGGSWNTPKEQCEIFNQGYVDDLAKPGRGVGFRIVLVSNKN
ncbi:hypothetical protein BKI52_34425 [marine bacterium AO1-C]|nr:hypothetical protein BKI52_34425 [marine bacterium AO1-C]